MDSEALFDALVAGDVVAVVDDDVVLTDRFDRRASEAAERLAADEAERLALAGEVCGSEDLGRRFLEEIEDPARLLGTYETVRSFLDGVPPAEYVRVLCVLDGLVRGRPPADGAPETFLPVAGDMVAPISFLHPCVLVYVWKHDCDPCDVLRETFEDFPGGLPEPVLPIAVYGPDSQDLLRDRFDVHLAPTTLFMKDGRVDSRLMGAHDASLYRNELDIVTEDLPDGRDGA